MTKLFEQFRYRHTMQTVWRDCWECIALAISNRVDTAQFDKREARYLEIAKRYTREELQEFSKIYAETTAAFHEEPEQDLIGSIAGELELLSKGMGQFFTPFAMSSMMAKMNLLDAAETVARDGFISLMEPCGGAGGMVIAHAMALADQKLDYTRHMHADLVDLDPTCVHMAYVQLSVLGIPARVTRGNSITQEFSETWFTPAHLLFGWPARLRARRAAEQEAAPAAPAPQLLLEAPVKKPARSRARPPALPRPAAPPAELFTGAD